MKKHGKRLHEQGNKVPPPEHPPSMKPRLPKKASTRRLLKSTNSSAPNCRSRWPASIPTVLSKSCSISSTPWATAVLGKRPHRSRRNPTTKASTASSTKTRCHLRAGQTLAKHGGQARNPELRRSSRRQAGKQRSLHHDQRLCLQRGRIRQCGHPESHPDRWCSPCRPDDRARHRRCHCGNHPPQEAGFGLF